MTEEDTQKLLKVTYTALRSEFGFMGDLRFDVANTVANVYFRYFQQAMRSAPSVSLDESCAREAEYKGIAKVIAEWRRLKAKGVHQSFLDFCDDLFLDVYKYRMPNVDKKIGLRRMIERKFRNTQDIPNLVSVLQLYQ